MNIIMNARLWSDTKNNMTKGLLLLFCTPSPPLYLPQANTNLLLSLAFHFLDYPGMRITCQEKLQPVSSTSSGERPCELQHQS
jgi:hypothetical protein